jgi:putative DNA primase/helicase
MMRRAQMRTAEDIGFGPELESTSPRFAKTDAGNADLFADAYAGYLRYDHTTRVWMVRSTHHWAIDRDGAVVRMAKTAIRGRLAEATRIVRDEERRAETKWALQSESRRGLDAMTALAQSAPGLAVTGDDWDRNPMLLGVSNGVVDLSTGDLRPGSSEDYITKVAPVGFNATARCPRWDRFMREVFADHAELVPYLQRVVGYTLTGITTEQAIWILFGRGANGKSTFIETLMQCVFGPAYGWTIPFPAGSWSDSMSEYQKAAIRGQRFVTSSEVAQRGRLNEELVKSLTGGDMVQARNPYGRPFHFVPIAKFFLRVNEKPAIRDESHGMWRRIKLVPFEQTFKVDRMLADTLRAEAPGILQWAIRGCLEWQRDGLGKPAIIQAATAEYRTENDALTDFLAECCMVHDGVSARAGLLFDRYAMWAADRVRPDDRLSRKAFSAKLRLRFESSEKGRHVIYFGIALVEGGVCR